MQNFCRLQSTYALEMTKPNMHEVFFELILTWSFHQELNIRHSHEQINSSELNYHQTYSLD